MGWGEGGMGHIPGLEETSNSLHILAGILEGKNQFRRHSVQ